MMQPKSIMVLHQETVSGLTVKQWESYIYLEYTELKTSYNTDIFEGDILRANDMNFEVRADHRGWQVFSKDGRCGSLHAFLIMNKSALNIGNMYPDPDLMQ